MTKRTPKKGSDSPKQNRRTKKRTVKRKRKPDEDFQDEPHSQKRRRHPKSPIKREKALRKKRSSAKDDKTPRNKGIARRRQPPSKRQRRPTRSKRLHWLWISISLMFGSLTGAGIAGFFMYYKALSDVTDWLSPNNAEKQEAVGHIYSDAISIWPGMSLDSQSFNDLLYSSGFSKTNQVESPGDFTNLPNATHLIPFSESTDGPASMVIVRFDDMGRISTMTTQDSKSIQQLKLPKSSMATFAKDPADALSPIQLDETPEMLVKAIIAMEDSRFYSHPGVDFLGVLRAIAVNLVAGSKKQGASTITQQLVKNLILVDSRKTYDRKAKEVIRAVALERILMSRLGQEKVKEAIIELYLNEVYLGNHNGSAIIGVRQAAKLFFGKPLGKLNVGESATIAGIISAPNAYSPIRHPEAATKRRDIALYRLSQMGWLDEDEKESWKQTPMITQTPTDIKQSPWFIDYVQTAIDKEYGPGAIKRHGLEIMSGINPAVQIIAEKSIQKTIDKLSKKKPNILNAQVALISISKDNQIEAMVGSVNYSKSQFNRSVDGQRHIGSIVKPFISLKAFEMDPNLGPGCKVHDKPLSISLSKTKNWEPKNYDGVFKDAVSIRETLVKSRNIPIVNISRSIANADPKRERWLPSWLKGLGLKSATTNPSVALGAFESTPLQLANAYTVFPNLGVYSSVNPISKVYKDKQLLSKSGKGGKKRLSSKVSTWLTVDMLADVMEVGTAKKIKDYDIKGPYYGKTGTTNNGRDSWFVGFDANRTIAVWVGMDKGESLGMTGSQAALPIFAQFAQDLASPSAPIKRPKTIELREVCRDAPHCQELDRDWFSKKSKSNPKCEAWSNDIYFHKPEGFDLTNWFPWFN